MVVEVTSGGGGQGADVVLDLVVYRRHLVPDRSFVYTPEFLPRATESGCNDWLLPAKLVNSISRRR